MAMSSARENSSTSGTGTWAAARLLPAAEEVVLPLDVPAPVGGDALHDAVEHLQQRAAVHAQAVEGPGAYEALHRAAVELPAGHAAAEVLQPVKGPPFSALVHELEDEFLAYVLHRREAEAYVPAETVK